MAADDEDWDEDALLRMVEEEEEYVPLKIRRLNAQAKKPGQKPAAEAAQDPSAEPPATAASPRPPPPAEPHQRPQTSLLKSSAEERRTRPELSEAQKVAQEEQQLMSSLLKKQALRSVQENAKGVVYGKPLQHGWTPPSWISSRSEGDHQRIRDRLHIHCVGTHIPPPVTLFAAMRLPSSVVKTLRSQGIDKPTPVQAQALPVILSGRDCVGVSYTGSGKTLVFVLPMLMFALQEEWRMPLQPGEGPTGLVVCPSRELARQTHDIVKAHARALVDDGWPELRSLLCIGGEDTREAGQTLRRGVHMAVCTPGRLKDFLSKRRMTLDICQYLCLDEADRMVDTGFEEDLREIMSFFKAQRQTVMFSATMPDKIRAFAASALVDPITVNISRGGAANLDVKQEIEYVKAEDKLDRVGTCLQKTAPPVLIFAEKTRDVDHVHEYLLQHGVNAVSVHGAKDQQERTSAIERFKDGRSDVLCATDVAGKGLDFDGIKHVINFDMPEEIEHYVHRIGRTGRRGKRGLATTFVSLKDNSETILLDLKYLLKEAKQPIPPVLQAIEDPMEKLVEVEKTSGHKGCAYCGGLGHRLQNCPKLRAESRHAQGQHSGRDGVRGLGGEM